MPSTTAFWPTSASPAWTFRQRNGTYVRQPESAPIENPTARQVSDTGSHGKDETKRQKYFIDVHDLES